MEDDLLAQLEDLAQKTDVLTNWADEMYEFVKAIPISKLSDVFQSFAEITSDSQNHCLTPLSSRSVRMRPTSKLISGRKRIYKRNTTLWPAWRVICS